ncbi:MAG: lipopolysaccharide biosynthesis protein [Chloroflexi bacterium]|nr:lipopolysaccharide biosynthesis protein [Chloroflexota bacterium]
MKKQSIDASGIRWAFLSNAASYITQPIVLILLARVLTPSDFGLLAMALTVVTFFELFRDMGLSQALIRQEGNPQELASSAFWTQFVLSIAMFGFVWAIAPLVGMYYRDLGVVPVLRVMAGLFLLYPFVDIPYAFLLRDLRFRALFLRQGVPALVGGGISLLLGWTGFGVWSLVVGMLMGRMTAGAVSMWMARWWPSFRISSETISMLRFGSQVSFQKVLGWVIVWLDRWFVGRFLGTASLGVYQVAMRIGEIPYLASGSPLALVAYPIMAQDSRERADIKRRYLSYLQGVALIGFPLGIGMVLIMPFAIPSILGPKWAHSIKVFQVILLYQTLGCIVSLNPEVFKALGKPEIMSYFFIARAIISVPVYFFAAQRDIMTLALAHLVLVLLFAPINMFITMRMVGLKLKQLLLALRSGLIMAVALSLIGLFYWWRGAQVIHSDGVNTALLAVLLIGVGIFILRMADAQAFRQMKRIIIPSLQAERSEE